MYMFKNALKIFLFFANFVSVYFPIKIKGSVPRAGVTYTQGPALKAGAEFGGAKSVFQKNSPLRLK